jgi:DNA helicase HerA-like ATPase
MTNVVERTAALTVGSVESVSPSDIRAILDTDAPQATALNAGTPHRFPRINGYIVIPNESGALVGLVVTLSIERATLPRAARDETGVIDLPFPTRRMLLTPVGTLRASQKGEYTLERGVAVFPSVGDPILLPTASQLRAIVEAQGANARLPIGHSQLAAHATVAVDPDKLFGRHLAVLGNTGSGKSCSVAGLIRWSITSARDESGTQPANARFIVLDPNGEYTQTFCDLGHGVRVFSVGDTEHPLTIPAWMWNSREWTALSRAMPGAQQPILMQALRDLRAGNPAEQPAVVRLARFLRLSRMRIDSMLASGEYAGTFSQRLSVGEAVANLATDAARYLGQEDAIDQALSDLEQRASSIATAHRSAWNERWAYSAFSEGEIEDIRTAIAETQAALPAFRPSGASEDAPIEFDVGDLPDYLEALASVSGRGGQFIEFLVTRIRMMLADGRLRPIVAPEESGSVEEWLKDMIGPGSAAPGSEITVVDLSLVPTEVIHIAIGVIGRLIFEALQRYRKLNSDELPTVLVLEEAHTFVRRSRDEDATVMTAAQLCRETFERIAREGRKFGLGLVLSSQRPSELSPTVLAQCNTFLLHRLVNDRDQDLVARLVPDNLGGLLRELPSLPSQQAILLGWAAEVPTLVTMRTLPPHHRPQSADPRYWDAWSGRQQRLTDWRLIAESWRS